MESSFPICIPAHHAHKFVPLANKFGARYRVGVSDAVRMDAFPLSHAEPRTAVGSVLRPLVFPHAMVRYCRSIWKADRDIRFSFVGLITDRRRSFIDDWTSKAFGYRATAAIGPEDSDGGFQCPPPRGEGLHLWSSTRGRRFPIKSWDEDYYQQLSRSQFVLCPEGDHPWSYRFWEAVLCGAIPIVERTGAYCEGYHIASAQSAVGSLAWSPADAEHNFELCARQLTIHVDTIDKELERLLK